MNAAIIVLIIIIILALIAILIYFFVVRSRIHHTPLTPPTIPITPPTMPPITPPTSPPTSPPITPPVAPSCPEFSRLVNRDITGFNMSGMPINGTEAQCQTLCINTSGCNWYNYSDTDNQCWLKSGHPKNNVITGFRVQDNPHGSTTCPAWYRIMHTDIPGFDMTNLSGYPFVTQSEQACQNLCVVNNCDWYNLDTATNTCYLKLATPKQGIITGLPINVTTP